MEIDAEKAEAEAETKRYHGAAVLHHLWIDILGRNHLHYTIGKAMRECGFSVEESKDTTKQMRVRRMKKSCSTSVPLSGAVPVSVVVTAPVQSPISAISEPSSSSISSSARNLMLGGCRRTQQQVHAAYKAEYETQRAEQERFKACTRWIADEQNKFTGIGHKKGVGPLLKVYSEQSGIPLADLPAVRTIQKAISEGRAGATPPRKGRKGHIEATDFNRLGEAVKAFVALCACSGDEKSYSDIKKLVNTVANSKADKEGLDRRDYTLAERIFKQFSVELNIDKLSRAEARRILWTTKANVNNMFNQWKELLLELGLADEKTSENTANAVELSLENILASHELFDTGELLFSLDQLRRIINLDETSLSLDGLDGNRGGRPSLSFHDPNLPRTGKSTSKCGYSATLVCGGNAAGEATPPHFQFPSMAQEQNQQLKYDTITGSRDVLGQFGHPAPVPLSPSYGMNEKGGMDEAHFEKYLLHLVLQLYPDAADIRGKRVLVKCDQGPGRSNLKLLARLRARGVFLFPSVPNSSSVTQELDQLFGSFKSKLRLNLERLHEALLSIGQSVSLGRDDCCRLIFGGDCILSDGSSVTLEEAFDIAFSRERMLAAFQKVGAAPLTRNCLSDPKVRVEINIDADEYEGETEKRIRLLEEQLKACVSYLQLNGFEKADLLLVRAKRAKPQSEKVTLPHSHERQLAILSANTIGAKYVAMDGNHLTHEDMFMAEEIRRRKAEIKVLEAEKNNRIAAKNREDNAMKLIKEKEEKDLPHMRIETDQKRWINPEIDVLLKWKNGGKVPPSKKEAKIAEWQRLKNKPAPSFSVWTADDEAKLQSLKSDIAIDDTLLGKERQRMIQETAASVPLMTEEQLSELQAKIDATRAAKATETNNVQPQSDVPQEEESNEAEEESNKDDGEEVVAPPPAARITRSRRGRSSARA